MHADRGEVPKGSAEIFFRKVKFWKEDEGGDAPPVFVGILFPNIYIGHAYSICMYVAMHSRMGLASYFPKLVSTISIFGTLDIQHL